MQKSKASQALIAYFKLLLSLPYQFGHLLHKSLYKLGCLHAQKLPVPVISVGNISFGGSGKTPFTIALANYLSKQGLRVGILTRGYNSAAAKAGRIVISSPAEIAEHSPEEIGDEPYLMLTKIDTKCRLIVGKNRFRAAMQALTLADYDVFILDDGMQHLALKRDLEIVLLNIHETGFMREFPYALKSADFLIHTKVDDQWLMENPDPYNFSYKLKLLRAPDPALPIAVVTAIADPQSFLEQLASHLNSLAESNPVNSTVYSSSSIQLFSFPDHHYFSMTEVNKLKSLGMNLVCTLKDFVKIPRVEQDSFIPVDLELQVRPSDLFARIVGKIKHGKS